MRELTYIYFSATGTTHTCVEHIGKAMEMPVKKAINLADKQTAPLPQFGEGDTLIVGMPVYGGRIPALAAGYLQTLSGNGATAIAVVVYGNRDYDDALLELTDILRDRGFEIVAASAFIGQHSIFPKVGTDRPDASDLKQLEAFGKQCKDWLAVNKTFSEISLKGNRPYKRFGGVPIHPRCDSRKCSQCGICATQCPVGAINSENPTDIDVAKCISCGRCIYVCTHHARSYSGIKYKAIETIFVASYSKRKEPEWFFAE